MFLVTWMICSSLLQKRNSRIEMKFLTEESDLTISSSLQCLYFYAPWIPFHKKMLVMLSKMEERFDSIQYDAIDVDHFKGLCKRFSINSVPTILILKNGKELKRITGLVLTSACRSAFADICKTES